MRIDSQIETASGSRSPLNGPSWGTSGPLAVRRAFNESMGARLRLVMLAPLLLLPLRADPHMTNLLIEVKSHTGRPIPQAGAVVKFVHGHNYLNDLKQRTRAVRERADDQSPRMGGAGSGGVNGERDPEGRTG